MQSQTFARTLSIMIGGSGEKYPLKLVAKHADRYNHPCGSIDLLKRKISKSEEHCATIGLISYLEIQLVCGFLLPIVGASIICFPLVNLLLFFLHGCLNQYYHKSFSMFTNSLKVATITFILSALFLKLQKLLSNLISR
jgi:hypothetical protein